MDRVKYSSGGTKTKERTSVTLSSAIVEILRKHQHDEQKPKLIVKGGNFVRIVNQLAIIRKEIY